MLASKLKCSKKQECSELLNYFFFAKQYVLQFKILFKTKHELFSSLVRGNLKIPETSTKCLKFQEKINNLLFEIKKQFNVF